MGHMSQPKQEYRGLMERLDHHAIVMQRPELLLDLLIRAD
jgi:hypothetical protein